MTISRQTTVTLILMKDMKERERSELVTTSGHKRANRLPIIYLKWWQQGTGLLGGNWAAPTPP
jgi:hypothetical protein